MTNKELSDKIDALNSSLNTLTTKLQSHLEVAEFVDKSSQKDIEKLTIEQKSIIKRLVKLETQQAVMNSYRVSKKEFLFALSKLFGLFCLLVGVTYTLIKLGIINGTSAN